MITLLTVKKGSGKTKKLIEMAYAALEKTNGNVVVVEKGLKLTYDISHAARLIDIDAYDVKGGKGLYGFLAGICAGNYDVTDILVDSTQKITGTGAEVMDLLVNDLKKLEKESGANFVLSVSAADEEIPESVKEAARIDGAGYKDMLKSIIMPLMMPAFTIGLFLSISNSFKMFDQNLALTQGGPYKSTEMLALNIYTSAFGAYEFGFAQAKAIIFMIAVAAIGVTQLVLTKRKEVEM